MNKCLFPFLLLFFFVSCVNNQLDYRIINLNSAKDELKKSIVKIDGMFKDKHETQLDSDELNLLKNIFKSSVDSFNEKRTEKIDLSNYRVFFVPTLNNKNQKLVFIYAYHTIEDAEWLKLRDVFAISDGGISCFTTVINLTIKVEGWITPNGEA